ncbi:hypothetical protein FRC03_011950 [Tulasnella sp. 419]|nr:hypothetical protein FRC03_011950 [Tulasnella sp. 419]
MQSVAKEFKRNFHIPAVWYRIGGRRALCRISDSNGVEEIGFPVGMQLEQHPRLHPSDGLGFPEAETACQVIMTIDGPAGMGQGDPQYSHQHNYHIAVHCPRYFEDDARYRKLPYEDIAPGSLQPCYGRGSW